MKVERVVDTRLRGKNKLKSMRHLELVKILGKPSEINIPKAGTKVAVLPETTFVVS